MNRLALVCTILLGVAKLLYGQNESETTRPASGAKNGDSDAASQSAEDADEIARAKNATEETIRFWERSVSVSDAQKKAFRELRMKNTRLTIAAYAKIADQRNKLGEAIRAAALARDEATYARLNKEERAMMEPIIELEGRAANKEFYFLTPEQQKRIKEHQPTIVIEDSTAPVKLSPAQLAHVLAWYAESEKAKGGDAGSRKLLSAVLPLLTSTQKMEILTARGDEFAKNILDRTKATPAQREQAKAIIKEVAKGIDFDKEWPHFSSLGGKLHPRVRAIFPPDQQEKAGHYGSVQLLPAGEK